MTALPTGQEPGVEFPELAPLSDVAKLTEDDRDADHLLGRLVRHAVSLVPGCAGAALTITIPGGGFTVATTGPDVDRCHRAQFEVAGDGPACETLQRNEPRRVDDLQTEDRWPRYCATARQMGFASSLALPLRTDRLPAAALNLYSKRPRTFSGTTHDVALLFAMHGGTALDNADLYRHSTMLVEQLHRALESRGLIERAKGLLMGQYDLTDEQAFEALRGQSQQQHRRLRDVAVDVLAEASQDSDTNPHTPWVPMRGRPQW